MRAPRLRRLAPSCRPLALALVLATPAILRAADPPVAGVVVDPSGAPLPRASVHIVDASGAERFSAFTDDRGRFRSDVRPEGCTIVASLTGFATASVPCGPSQAAVRVPLKVAPIAESIVVTATKTAAPADQTGASVTLFTADDLNRRQAPLVTDLLRTSPGAMVVQTGAPGSVTSLFVRGGESNYNKVLLDGIPLNEPGGTFNFSNLTTENLDRIEIVRGAQSALFGSDAMASVVQLFTKRADLGAGAPRVDLSIEGGTYDTAHASAAVSGRTGSFDYSVAAARISTDNRVPNNAFTNTTLSGTAGLALGSSAILRIVGRGELERTGEPGQTEFERPDLDAFFGRHDGMGGVTFEQQVTNTFHQRVSYSLAVSDYQSTDLVADPDYTPRFGASVAPFAFSDFTFDSRTRLQRHHASYQGDWRLTGGDTAAGDHRLTVLADWDGERATLEDRLAGTSTPASRNNVGLSVEEQALWPRLFVTVGGRIEHNDSFGTAAVPRGSIVFVAHNGSGAVGDTRLKASAGLGIKEPTILQSFSPSPFFLGNPNLQPERSRTIDAGIEQRLAGDRARIEATWFDNRFRNLIATETIDPVTFDAEYFNIGLTQARGAELSFDAAPIRPIRVRAGYTFLDSEVLESTSPSSPVFQVGQWLFRRPRHSGFFGATWSWKRTMADLSGVFVGRFVDSDFASLEPPLLSNPGFTTWNARASYRVTARLRALLAVDNLANADYMEPLGYQALGRAARVGLRVEF